MTPLARRGGQSFSLGPDDVCGDDSLSLLQPHRLLDALLQPPPALVGVRENARRAALEVFSVAKTRGGGRTAAVIRGAWWHDSTGPSGAWSTTSRRPSVPGPPNPRPVAGQVRVQFSKTPLVPTPTGQENGGSHRRLCKRSPGYFVGLPSCQVSVARWYCLVSVRDHKNNHSESWCDDRWQIWYLISPSSREPGELSIAGWCGYREDERDRARRAPTDLKDLISRKWCRARWRVSQRAPQPWYRKAGWGAEESPGLVRQSVDAVVRRERGWPSRPESCAASLLSRASNMRPAPLQFPRRSSLGTTSQAMEIHQCLLGPFDGCNAGPDQSKRNATTADARCALRTKRRAGAHTDRARLKRLLPTRGASSSFVPPGPTSVRPTSPRIHRSTKEQHTDDIRPHRSAAPAATSTRPALELERE